MTPITSSHVPDTTTGLHDASATRLASLVREGAVTATAIANACLAQIARVEGTIGAWAHLSPDIARQHAAALDRRGQPGTGLLAGVPIGVKDIFNTADMPTAMGSPLWSGFTPGNDARVVTDLRLEGGVILGKTVTAEFAVHTPNGTRNPFDPSRSPGTSSSGSAAAVAARMVPVAIGSQTAGSVVRPASYCGVFGCKPSFGLVPRTGSLKTTDSLDTVGWFARTIDDIELLFDVLHTEGRDYPIATAKLAEERRTAPTGRPWRIAAVRGPMWPSVTEEAQAQFEAWLMRARSAGLEVVEPALPEALADAHQVHADIYDSALAYYFSHEFAHGRLMSDTLRALIARGQTIGPARYREALTRQRLQAAVMDQWFADVDVLVTLSTAGPAPEGLTTQDPPDSCLVWTLCGLPALSVPAFLTRTGLPFGLQLVARRYHDRRLFAVTRLLQSLGLAPTDAPRPADCDGPYLRWFNDPEVCRYNSHYRLPYTREQALAYIAATREATDRVVLAIIDRETNRHVGNISLQQIEGIDRSAEFAIVIGERDVWGRGYGVEAGRLLLAHAFDRLNLHRVHCGTLVENRAMRRLAEHLGMREEGRRREAAFVDGRYHDVVEFGVLRREFRALADGPSERPSAAR